jgi:glycosyltransferase involved in cell wall biosynthesis
MGSFGAGYGRVPSLLYKTAERHCASRSDVIVFVGKELLSLYTKSDVVPGDRAMVIRSPIDVEPLIATRAWTDTERGRVKQRLGIDPHDQLIVAIGALEPRKRYRLMLRKVAPLLRDGNARLAIAGAGPDREELERTAHELQVASSVDFLGHVEDIAELLAAANVLVHTSLIEGVPQVVIQVLAAGRPVVATEASGLREVPGAPVTVVGADGEGLCEAVRRAIESPAGPAAEGALTGWTCRAIDPALHTFHRRLRERSR